MILVYEIIFDEETIKFLNQLPKEYRGRIFNKIITAKDNPFHFFEKLSGRAEYKLRVGDYRVIADLDQNDKKIKIVKIGHRRNIYKKISEKASVFQTEDVQGKETTFPARRKENLSSESQ